MPRSGGKELCNGCGHKVNKRNLRKKDDKKYCGTCIKKHRTTMRVGTHNPSAPPKSIITLAKRAVMPERRIIKRKTFHQKFIAPIIPGSIRERKRKKIVVMSMYLTRDEKYVLYKKYTKERNYSPAKARKKIQKIVESLDVLIKKLRNERKSDGEIMIRFREEFAKLVEEK